MSNPLAPRSLQEQLSPIDKLSNVAIANNVFLYWYQGQIHVDCEIDAQYVSLELPVGIRDVRIVYDYTMPLALYMIGGQAEIAFGVSIYNTQ